MKRLYFLLCLSLGIMIIGACQKSDENLDVDLSAYHTDKNVETELDGWIKNQLTDPYNIEVVYRFERNLTDVSRNVSPTRTESVKPIMEAVIKGFLEVYGEVADPAFIKQYTPKQFVMYGSGSYNPNGTYTLATAEGGRKVVFYSTNIFDLNDPESARHLLRVIHHEFTHIINQIVPMPADFQLISVGDYMQNWNTVPNADEVAKELGFLSPYCRSNPSEDFAEMVAIIVGEGQIFFDNYVASVKSAESRNKLRAKERAVREYFKTFFDIDLAQLEEKVQDVLRNDYGATDPLDLTQTLPLWLLNNKVASIRYEPTAAHYALHGDPVPVRQLINNVQVAYRTQNPGWSTGNIPYMEFIFPDAQRMTFRIGFRTDPASAIYMADYYFDMLIDASTGEVMFKRSTDANGDLDNVNGYRIRNGFEQYVLPYLTNRKFVADWLPTSITPDSDLYRTFGGFYEKGNPTNYVYGPIILK